MELVGLAMIGLAMLLAFSLGSRGGGAGVIPSSKIYDIYSDITQPIRGDSDTTKEQRRKLRESLAQLERGPKGRPPRAGGHAAVMARANARSHAVLATGAGSLSNARDGAYITDCNVRE